jgi:general stress protein 26
MAGMGGKLPFEERDTKPGGTSSRRTGSAQPKETAMPTPAELETKFWKALKSDRTALLGLSRKADGHAQPMTAQVEGDEGGPIWFFSASDVDLVQAIGGGADAFLHFADKRHELFASIEGRLSIENDRAAIERLWNPFVAAWFEEGKDDPKLRLLRFEPANAQVWLNENSLFAGVKMLLGSDPKEDFKDKVAQMDLG